MSLNEWGPFESTTDGTINYGARSEYRELLEPGPRTVPATDDEQAWPVATYWQCIDPNTPWVCRSCLALSPDDPRHVPCWNREDDE